MRIYPKEINLKCRNRYKENIKLEQIHGSKYKLVVPDPYIRCLFKEDNKTIVAVDPSGGPFISVGDKVTQEYVIERFYHSLTYQCFIVELKDRAIHEVD